MQDLQALLTTAEVATRLNRSVATINRWVVEGRLPAARQVGSGRTGARLYSPVEVDTLAAELLAEAEADAAALRGADA